MRRDDWAVTGVMVAHDADGWFVELTCDAAFHGPMTLTEERLIEVVKEAVDSIGRRYGRRVIAELQEMME